MNAVMYICMQLKIMLKRNSKNEAVFEQCFNEITQYALAELMSNFPQVNFIVFLICL